MVLQRIVFRVALAVVAVVAVCLLAVPALATGGDPAVADLDIEPETVWVGENVSKAVYFEATFLNVDTAQKVYLIFKKARSTDLLQAELAYDKGVWAGRALVTRAQVGTWDLEDCFYVVDENGTDRIVTVAYGKDEADVETRFAVRERTVTPLVPGDGDKYKDIIAKRLLAPRHLRAAVDYGDNGEAETVELNWRCRGDYDKCEFAVYAGYSAGKMVKVAAVKGKLNCVVDVEDVVKALGETKKPKGKKLILFRVKNEAGKSNVAVVRLTEKHRGKGIKIGDRDKLRLRDGTSEALIPPGWAKNVKD
ncbi:hypothetical protein ACP3TJ_10200 [Desulforudis sp. 1088]|uniref:hypothetical protein n=2 Tax=Candidatus Desulforudis TaxID=471826 RepID=UPI003CE57209